MRKYEDDLNILIKIIICGSHNILIFLFHIWLGLVLKPSNDIKIEIQKAVSYMSVFIKQDFSSHSFSSLRVGSRGDGKIIPNFCILLEQLRVKEEW